MRHIIIQKGAKSSLPIEMTRRPSRHHRAESGKELRVRECISAEDNQIKSLAMRPDTTMSQFCDTDLDYFRSIKALKTNIFVRMAFIQ